MAYIGRSPSYGAFEKQVLTADSSTTSFALNYTVGSTSSILVSVAGVVQEPEVAYNLTSGGTSIVFSGAPTSGDTVFVIYLGIATDVGTISSGVTDIAFTIPATVGSSSTLVTGLPAGITATAGMVNASGSAYKSASTAVPYDTAGSITLTVTTPTLLTSTVSKFLIQAS